MQASRHLRTDTFGQFEQFVATGLILCSKRPLPHVPLHPGVTVANILSPFLLTSPEIRKSTAG